MARKVNATKPIWLPLGCPECYQIAAGLGEAAVGAGVGFAAYEAIKDIISLFEKPAFHGSLKPRPNAQPWDEGNIHYGPNIAGALGLPDDTCEFGACGGGFGFQDTPVHGPWTYGNWCGAGGMGTPINGVDNLCMWHDLNFKKTGADWTNMQSDANWNKLQPDQQQQVQQYNQQLCDGMAKVNIPWWNISESTAAWEIGVFFRKYVPKGAQCH